MMSNMVNTPELSGTVTTRNTYLFYRGNSYKPVHRDVYYKIIDDYMKYMMDKLFDGHDISLGEHLGSIAIRCRKVLPRIGINGEVCGVAPAWAKTKKLWTENAEALGMTFKEYVDKVPQSERRLVYCFNEHTNGLKFNLLWYKRNATVQHKIYYNLIFSRRAKRRLSKAAYDGVEYQEVPPRVTRKADKNPPKTLQELEDKKEFYEEWKQKFANFDKYGEE